MHARARVARERSNVYEIEKICKVKKYDGVEITIKKELIAGWMLHKGAETWYLSLHFRVVVAVSTAKKTEQTRGKKDA